MHVTKLTLDPDKFPTRDYYPFKLAIFQQTRELALSAPITFFMGENGTGKSTLLEAIALKCGIHIWSGMERTRYEINPYERSLFKALEVQWRDGAVTGSYFSSQIFRNFSQLVDEWATADPGSLAYLGGKSLLTQSHGQALISFFQARYKLRGLYLLDEPETALSPRSQMELLRLMVEMSDRGQAQFIIATHSPILLAAPGAVIYDFNQTPINTIAYNDTEYFQFYKDFLNNREKYLTGLKRPLTCTIIGAGMAGLMAARVLQDAGMQVSVLDKGKGLGGRLATRRIQDDEYGEGVFDYGAQYFTARSDHFRHWVEQWQQQGILKTWSVGFATGAGQLKEDDVPRYIGAVSNRDIAKHLAQNLTVQTQTRVTHIAWQQDHWQVRADNGATYSSDVLVLTPPLPQTLTLLEESSIALPPELPDRLGRISYQPCIALLLLLKSASQIPAPGGLWLDGNPIAWMADNTQKGISPNGFAVTIHASAPYSLANWDKPDATIYQELFAAATPWLKADVAQYQVHRWRYSQASSAVGEPMVFLDQPGPLVLAGDAFLGQRIEGAALSGLAAAKAILESAGIKSNSGKN